MSRFSTKCYSGNLRFHSVFTSIHIIFLFQDAFKLIHNDDTQIQNILDKLRFRLFFDDFFEEARSELITENLKNRKIVVPTSETQNVEKDIKLPLSGRCQKSDT